jgi:hypothetical protein
MLKSQIIKNSNSFLALDMEKARHQLLTTIY